VANNLPDTDAILILEVFEKKTNKTPKSIIDVCKRESNVMKQMSKKVKDKNG